MARLLVPRPCEKRERRAAGGGARWSHRRCLRDTDTVGACARREARERPSGPRVEHRRRVADPELEPFGAPILSVAAESVPTSEAVTTEITFVVARFQVDLLLIVSGQVPEERRYGGHTES